MPTVTNISTPSAVVPIFPHNGLAYTPPNDTDTFVDSRGDAVPVSVWVGGTGNVTVLPFGATTTVTFTGVPAGTVLPVMVRRINLTGLTATSLVVIY